MQVTEIVVSAGRTFNHPYEQYSNLKPNVTLKATLSPGEDVDGAVRQLQAKAESVIEDHKRMMLQQLEQLEQMSRREQQISSLESRLKTTQCELDRLRAQDTAALAPPTAGSYNRADDDTGDVDDRKLDPPKMW